MVKLPNVSARSDFKALLKKMGLQARGTGGVDSAATGGTWDISNADRIGKGEVQLCNTLIEGAAQLVKWENQIETGDKAAAEAEIEAMVAGEAPLSPKVTKDDPFVTGLLKKVRLDKANVESVIPHLEPWLQELLGSNQFLNIARDKFNDVDKDSNGKLTPDELTPIITDLARGRAVEISEAQCR